MTYMHKPVHWKCPSELEREQDQKWMENGKFIKMDMTSIFEKCVFQIIFDIISLPIFDSIFQRNEMKNEIKNE